MSNTAVIDIPIDVMDRLSTATFEELADTATAAIDRAASHAMSAISQLIIAGGALREMHDRMPGRFTEWLQATGIDRGWASKCQRLHAYRDQLPPEAFRPYVNGQGSMRQPSLRSALATISNLAPLPKRAEYAPSDPDPDTSAAVKRMLNSGATYKETAAVLGITLYTVRRVALGAAGLAEAERKARASVLAKRKAQTALRREAERSERDALARTSGKELSCTYSSLRKALAALDRADVANPNTAIAKRAHDYLTAAESCIVSLMRAERASQ